MRFLSKNIPEMGKGIAETYHRISACLIYGLNQAGITCSPHSFFVNAQDVKREIKLPCFLAPNRNEIMCRGRK